MNKVDVVIDYLNENKGDFASTYMLREIRDEIVKLIESNNEPDKKQQDILSFVRKESVKLDNVVIEDSFTNRIRGLLGTNDGNYRTVTDKMKEKQHLKEIENIITGKSIYGQLHFDRE